MPNVKRLPGHVNASRGVSLTGNVGGWWNNNNQVLSCAIQVRHFSNAYTRHISFQGIPLPKS